MIKPGESVEIVTPTPLVAEQKTPMYDSVYLTDTEIIKTSNSSQPQIRLAGVLPSSCHKLLLKVDNIDVDNNILIKVFSTVSLPNSCSQEKQLFDNILVLDGLKPGIYTVWVSQGKIGEVTIP